ncbi:MAG: hypothetical protein QM621_00845 [Aeromicrobium sp.]|uniref:hypothetical protein n=1 Tax=Aeromicrobium sp. TaxID=1871063 RepID=UPI0039E51229
MPAPLSPYPPAQDAWRFPPPPVSPRWLWVAIVIGVVGLLVSIGFIATVVVFSSSDLPSVVDDPELIEAVSHGCDELDAALDDTSADSPDPATRAQQIEAQNDIVRSVVDDWVAFYADASTDEPFDGWLGDWELLLQSRADYAVALQSDPTTRFSEPEADGESIIERMNGVADQCPVPELLLEPDAGI